MYPDDTNRVITSSLDRTIKIVDLRMIDQGPIKTLEGHTGAVTCISITNGISRPRIISCGEDRRICEWDVR